MKDNYSNLDTSFMNNLSAVMSRRFNSYKRNKKGFLNDVIVPVILLIVGIGLSKISYLEQSPSRL
jgi:hypothetical protein